MRYNSKIEWRDEYKIGVEIVDNAHKELFAIVHKIIELSKKNMSSEASKMACAEGIKFFKNYVVEHFSQEEAYMRSVNYDNYLAHKRRHDIMKNETIPSLDRELKEENFSRSAVEHFYDVCIGWLSTHIIIEDGAIVKNYKVRWNFEKDKAIPGIERLFKEEMRVTFKTEVMLLDSNYNGNPLEKPLCEQFVYKNIFGKRVKVLFEIEERLVTSLIEKTLGVSFGRFNNISLTAMTEMMLTIIQRISSRAKLMDYNYQLLSQQRVTTADVQIALYDEYFKYKLLFGSDDGSFAFCFTPVIEEVDLSEETELLEGSKLLEETEIPEGAEPPKKPKLPQKPRSSQKSQKANSSPKTKQSQKPKSTKNTKQSQNTKPSQEKS